MKKYFSQSESKNPEWIYTDIYGKQIINRQKLYLHIKDKLPIKITDRGNYFLFGGKTYRPISERELKALIKEFLPVEYRNKKDWTAVFDELQTDFPNIEEDAFNADENIVCFNNGVLKLDTMEFTNHSDEYLVTRMIPCNYFKNKTLDDAPIFKSYLNKLVNEDKETITFLMEFLGAVISNVYGYRFKRLLMLVGKGNTGKSQFRELLINLVGESNCTSIDMGKLQKTFGTSQLYGKRFAGSGDMSNMDIEELNIVKELTGGDEISAEFKGKDAFTFKYRGFLGFNANDLPFFRGDRGTHVYERFNIVRCNNVIPYNERDPHLLDKMLKEKDSIASTAIIFLKDAIDRGYKFTESETMKIERKQYEIHNNSLLCFVNDCCILSNRKITKRSDFNRVYKVWCKENSIKPERDREIGTQLQEKYGISAKKTYGQYYYPLEINEDIYNEYILDDDGHWKRNI